MACYLINVIEKNCCVQLKKYMMLNTKNILHTNTTTYNQKTIYIYIYK